MQIDWITVAAQIVNFLVLVWLLHHFLYGPIMRAMDRREQRIAERLRDAEQKGEAAEDEARAYREKQAELEADRDRFLAEAREAALQERKALQEAGRAEVDQQKREWLQQVEAQRAEFLRDIRERSTAYFYELARRALADLADAGLEEQIARMFVDRLGALDRETKHRIAGECGRFDNRILVRSRFELPPGEKRQITKAIHDNILDAVDVAYEEDAGMAGGMELRAGGQIVSWNFDDYLDDLERRIGTDIGALSPSAR